MAFSNEARKSAALARKIKHRLGEAAYREFRKTGRVPAGLEGAPSKPSSKAKKAAETVPSAPGRLPAGPKRTTSDLKYAELASKLTPLSDKKTYDAFAHRRLPPSQTTPIAREQARASLPDRKLIQHYKDSGIFTKRGLKPEQIKKIRDDWYTGKPVPLWALPQGTDVAVYRSSDATVPDLVGRTLGVVRRKPLDEHGKPGLSFEVPYIRFRDQQGRLYEYPALLTGSKNAPHATHPSFAAVTPIAKGHVGISTIGWGFPNFADDETAGPSAVPDIDMDTLATNILRATHMAISVEGRRKQAESAKSEFNQAMNKMEDKIQKGGKLGRGDRARLEIIALSGSIQEKARASELLRSLGFPRPRSR